MNKFPIGSSVECEFRGFKFKQGGSWAMIQACFKTPDDVWMNSPFWRPNQTRLAFPDGEFKELGSIEEQEEKIFGKLTHILEVLGCNISSIPAAENMEELYQNLHKEADKCWGKRVYVKTIEKNGETVLSSWYPFVSISPNKLRYNENEIV